MLKRCAVRGALVAGVWLRVVTAVSAGELSVVSALPEPRSDNNPILSKIVVQFDRPVLPSSVTANSFWAFGRNSGSGSGSFSFSNSNQTVTLTPTKPFISGEGVMVVLSHDLQAADGSPLRSAGYAFQFGIRARPAAMSFANIATMSNRTTPGSGTRIYGALSSDLNQDGFLDLATVNEDSADIRVFLNRADGSGLYHDWLRPPFPISLEASPNEPADFNRDGVVDMCAAATMTDSAWICLGNGDGTFSSPGQEIGVGDQPHGIAVLDVDGDGDIDVATCNTGDDDVSLMLNNGSGVFGPPTSFDGGGSGEYGLSAADMNEDGIFDLVVGTRYSQDITVHLGNGDGTFTALPSTDAGGLVWMISCGDVNGDGHTDVTTANSQSNSGSILIGNGAGGVTLTQVQPNVSHTVATDLGDLDGDGDLDWVMATFAGGLWRVYKNNGAGVFTFNQQFVAVSNPSCAIIYDFDNDRDLDLALTDEIADLIKLEKNSGTAALGDFDNDGDIDLADYSSMCLGGPNVFTPPPGCSQANFINSDLEGDGDADLADVALFQSGFGS